MSQNTHSRLRTRFFTDLYDHTKAMLMKAGLDEVKADAQARQFVGSIRLAWAGASLYIPTTDEMAISERDQQIWDKFNGSNQNELAIEFKVSLQWVYKIVKYMKILDVKKRQGSLAL